MFRAANSKFQERDTQVLGISTDPRPVQAAYSNNMGNINYPILSDFHPQGEVSRLFGVYNDENATSFRSIIVIDKDGVVRFKRSYTSAGDIDTSDILSEVDKLG